MPTRRSRASPATGLRYDHFPRPTACRSLRAPLCMTQCPSARSGSRDRSESDPSRLVRRWFALRRTMPPSQYHLLETSSSRGPTRPRRAKRAYAKAKAGRGCCLQPRGRGLPRQTGKPPAAPAARPAGASCASSRKNQKSDVNPSHDLDLCTQLKHARAALCLPSDAAKARASRPRFPSHADRRPGGGERTTWLAQEGRRPHHPLKFA